MSQDLLFERRGAIAILTFNRPAAGNSLGGTIHADLVDAWMTIRDDPEIRAAIVTGAGERHFCTGADVGNLNTDGKSRLQNLPIDRVVRFTAQHLKVWKPVICAVNGLANGAGLHFVVDADIVVASRNAAFMDSHVNVGQVGAIENIGLTKRLPLGSALRMTLQGKSYRMPAERAWQLGLVDELVETPADVLPKALEIAEEIAKNSPNAVALSKEALWKSLETGYSHALDFGWILLKQQWSHPDFVEGPRAFQEKRAPVWDPDPNARRSE